ncbi:flagellar hook protein FlgE [Rugamonas sp. DEMB1]|uniref:flagellar hook protein FlgE n=1 Tax=Rugamonas sp. DEMB1 TaxID=3039386 RepID=UPI002446A0EB|nr:flagellar hook protein FlgE [Rugamonas sp. DEMB1]WGG51669.1 flagellar hook protein FlgE [Rugamonas sp. DEMB1]
MFQQGLSGLNGAAKSLDIIGNNIANASTVGFKGSQAQFADLYANSLNGVSGNNAGIGVTVARIAQQFTQGNIETSANPLDISINGGGFFRTVVNGATQYSRNGQFQLDKTGGLINAQGAQLTGYLTNTDGVILQGSPVPIIIDSSDLKPIETTKAGFQLNLSSTSVAPTKIPFNAMDPLTYNKQTVLEVFDSLGGSHSMGMYYVKTTGGTWDVYASNDGVAIEAKAAAQVMIADQGVKDARAAYLGVIHGSPAPDGPTILAAQQAYSAVAGPALLLAAQAAGASQEQQDHLTSLFTAPTDVGAIAGNTPDLIDKALTAGLALPAVKVGTLVFNTSGELSIADMALLTPAQSLPFNITLPIFPDNGSKLNLNISTDFTGSTQYTGTTSERPSSQNGQSSGHLERFAAGSDGVILGQYSNGKSRPLAQIVLANFASVDGLTPLGNNAWAESASSGPPQIGAPGEGKMGKLRSQSIEVSNVDLTAELVNMITAQRVYQANAQTIKTQDSVLQTLVNLR